MNYDSLIRKIERLEELMVSIDYQTNDCEFVQKSVQIIGKCIVEEKNGKEIEEDMLVE